MKFFKTMFKAMWFMAKAIWFCIVFIILYAFIQECVSEQIKKHREKKEGEMANKNESQENPND